MRVGTAVSAQGAVCECICAWACTTSTHLCVCLCVCDCEGLRVCVQVGMSISGLPEGFNPHKGIKRVFDGRRKMMETGEGVDWGFAEALAFGTLVSEGQGISSMLMPAQKALLRHLC